MERRKRLERFSVGGAERPTRPNYKAKRAKFFDLAGFAAAQMADTIRQERTARGGDYPVEGTRDPRLIDHEDGTQSLGSEPVTELRICEVPHLTLRSGKLYRFTVDPKCPKCRVYTGDFDMIPVRRLL